MKSIHIKQKWKGSFNYLAGYTVLDQYIEVEFSMEITISDNSFVGTSIDSESKNIFEEPATVTGFIEEKMISFIMKYPYYYYKNEDDEIVSDPTAEHPDIHYLGYLDDDNKQVSGNWEMTVSEEKDLDGYILEVATGEFQMRKIN